MSTRSITPRISCSEPIGISVATTCGPNAPLSDSSVRKKSARSRSSMLTKIRRATPSSEARCHSRCVETSTPITPLTTNTADSHTRRAPSASIRLTLTSRHWKEASDAEIDIPRAFSSSSASDTVVPSVTLPRRVVAPASNRSASCSEVLPLPRWPTSATLRILLAAWGMPMASFFAPASLAAGLCRGTLACAPGLVAQVVALQAALQPQHRLGVQLRDAGLGHAEDFTDLAQRQVLVVVERDHELLALGQGRDRVGQPVLELGGREQLLRVGRVRIVQRVEQRDLVAGGVRHRPQLVERDDRGVGDLDERLLEFVEREVELVRHLLVRRRPVQAVLELAVRALDL